MTTYKTDNLVYALTRYADDLTADAKRVNDLAAQIRDGATQGNGTTTGDAVWAGSYLGENVLRLMGSTMNTSGRISAMESAIEQAFALARQKKPEATA